jgi:hypothetical protein
MTMNTRTIQFAAAAWLAAGALAGCGGGGGGDEAQAPDAGGNVAPANASASTDGLVAYVTLLTKSTSDVDAAVDLSQFTLPSDGSDTAVAVATPNDGLGL